MRPITGKELCRRLEEGGWALKRVKGSHYIFAKPAERKIPVVGEAAFAAGNNRTPITDPA